MVPRLVHPRRRVVACLGAALVAGLLVAAPPAGALTPTHPASSTPRVQSVWSVPTGVVVRGAPAAAIDAAGVVTLSWITAGVDSAAVYAARGSGSSWKVTRLDTVDLSVEPQGGYWQTQVLASGTRTAVVWEPTTGTAHDLSAAVFDRGAWSTVADLSTGDPLRTPAQAEADTGGFTVAWLTGAPTGGAAVHVSRWSGDGWGTSLLDSGASEVPPQVVQDGRSHATVLWPRPSAVMAAGTLDGGWSAAEQVAALPVPIQNTFSEIWFRAAGALDGTLVAAWRAGDALTNAYAGTVRTAGQWAAATTIADTTGGTLGGGLVDVAADGTPSVILSAGVPKCCSLQAVSRWTGTGWSALPSVQDPVPSRVGGRWVMLRPARVPAASIDGTVKRSWLVADVEGASAWQATRPAVVSGSTSGRVGSLATTTSAPNSAGDLVTAFGQSPSRSTSRLGVRWLHGRSWSPITWVRAGATGACTADAPCVVVARGSTSATVAWSLRSGIRAVQVRR